MPNARSAHVAAIVIAFGICALGIRHSSICR
jgi:hypothetical protein